MKNANQTAETKLIKKFDMDLRNVLLADLEAYKQKTQFVNKQLTVAA